MKSDFILLSSVARIFKLLLYYSKSFTNKGFVSLHDLENNNLASAASRITKPHVFSKFQEYCENTLKQHVNFDFTYVDASYVKEADYATLKIFESQNWNFSKLNFSYLIKAAVFTGKQFHYFDNYSEVLKPNEAIVHIAKDTSAGYPIYGKKTSKPARMDALTWVSKFLTSPEINLLQSNPTTIYHRFVVKLSDDLLTNTVKVRMVWGESFRTLLLETLFFHTPLSYTASHFSKTEDIHCSIGKTNIQVSESLKHIRSNNNKLLEGDFKLYDSSIPSWVIVLYFAVRSQSISFIGNEFNIYKMLCVNHIFTPFCYGSTEIRYKGQGEASGSRLTTDLNSFVNALIINYCYFEKSRGKSGSPEFSYCVMGDDNVLSLDYFSFEYYASVVLRFGLELNKLKSKVTSNISDLSYLGRFWNLKNEPYQKINWYVSHICVPSKFFVEKDIPNYVIQTYRAISVCAPLHDGLNTLLYLMNGQDSVLNGLIKKLKAGEKVEIEYFGREDLNINKINLRTLLTLNWRYF